MLQLVMKPEAPKTFRAFRGVRAQVQALGWTVWAGYLPNLGLQKIRALFRSPFHEDQSILFGASIYGNCHLYHNPKVKLVCARGVSSYV